MLSSNSAPPRPPACPASAVPPPPRRPAARSSCPCARSPAPVRSCLWARRSPWPRVPVHPPYQRMRPLSQHSLPSRRANLGVSGCNAEEGLTSAARAAADRAAPSPAPPAVLLPPSGLPCPLLSARPIFGGTDARAGAGGGAAPSTRPEPAKWSGGDCLPQQFPMAGVGRWGKAVGWEIVREDLEALESRTGSRLEGVRLWRSVVRGDGVGWKRGLEGRRARPFVAVRLEVGLGLAK